MDNTVESDSTSEIDDQTKAWESDPRLVTQRVHDADNELNPLECGIGHRVQASRSVLALVLDEECVFAGLQGGDIVVRTIHTPTYHVGCVVPLTVGRRGRLRPTISYFRSMRTKKAY